MEPIGTLRIKPSIVRKVIEGLFHEFPICEVPFAILVQRAIAVHEGPKRNMPVTCWGVKLVVYALNIELLVTSGKTRASTQLSRALKIYRRTFRTFRNKPRKEWS